MTEQHRMTIHTQMLEVARVIAMRGTCSRLKVGAVVARGGRILSTGYNGAPSGLQHCVHSDDTPCTIAVHAEANAICFAARQGSRVEGAEIYCTHMPCLYCSSLIINAGISQVFYAISYRDNRGNDALWSAGVVVTAL